jgi:hypothetical protein
MLLEGPRRENERRGAVTLKGMAARFGQAVLTYALMLARGVEPG